MPPGNAAIPAREAGVSQPLSQTRHAIRDLPIPMWLHEQLVAHRNASSFSADDDYVFVTAVGTPPQHRNLVPRILDPAQREAGLSERLTWHDLRHVTASRLIARGAPVTYVSRFLGHASPAITMEFYSHLFAAAAQRAAFREVIADPLTH